MALAHGPRPSEPDAEPQTPPDLGTDRAVLLRSQYRQSRRWLTGLNQRLQPLVNVILLVLIGVALAFAIVTGRAPQPTATDVEAVRESLAPDAEATPASAVAEVPTEAATPQDSAAGTETARTPLPVTPPVTAPTQSRAPVQAPPATFAPELPAAPSPASEPAATIAPAPSREPLLTVSPSAVTFANDESVKTVVLRNEGEGQITWRVTPQQSWLVVSPGGGTLTGNATVQIRVNRELVGRGQRSGSLLIDSTAGTVIISVTLE